MCLWFPQIVSPFPCSIVLPSSRCNLKSLRSWMKVESCLFQLMKDDDSFYLVDLRRLACNASWRSCLQSRRYIKLRRYLGAEIHFHYFSSSHLPVVKIASRQHMFKTQFWRAHSVLFSTIGIQFSLFYADISAAGLMVTPCVFIDGSCCLLSQHSQWRFNVQLAKIFTN